jgi:spore coat protein JB
MNEREKLLKEISEYQFAVFDLQLFLDTHTQNAEVLKKMKTYRDEMNTLVKEYEEKFGPLTKNMNTSNNWNWIKAPWPWETEEDN